MDHTLTPTKDTIRVTPDPSSDLPQGMIRSLQPDTQYDVVLWVAHDAYLALRERDNWSGPQYRYIGSVRTLKPYGVIT